MKVSVRGHYARRKVGEKIVTDIDNPTQEAAVPVYIEVWIDPYDKTVTERKRGNDGRFKRNP
jgi:hypothetical protein